MANEAYSKSRWRHGRHVFRFAGPLFRIWIHKKTLIQNIDVSFVVSLNKLLNIQSIGGDLKSHDTRRNDQSFFRLGWTQALSPRIS